jgi:hypothetical protein
MRPKIVLGMFVIGSVPLLFMALWWNSRNPPKDESTVASRALDLPNASAPPYSRQPVAVGPAVSIAVPSQPPTEQATEDERTALLEETLEDIQRLLHSGDLQSLMTILDQLSNPEKQVREAALDAVIRMDNPHAIPQLKVAAERAMDSKERAAILNAIEYLELPSLSQIGLAGRDPSAPSGATSETSEGQSHAKEAGKDMQQNPHDPRPGGGSRNRP